MDGERFGDVAPEVSEDVTDTVLTPDVRREALAPFDDEAAPNGTVLRPIPKWPGYYAGDDGHIHTKKTGRLSMLVPFPGGRDHCPYLKVQFSNKGRKKNFYVHNLIALAFLGKRPRSRNGKAPQVRHRDGDRFNNRPTNLMWGTKKQNEADKVAAGTAPRGARNGRSKLSDQVIDAIHASERTPVRLAADYDVHVSTIQRVLKRKTWRHLART